jgi:protein SCO1
MTTKKVIRVFVAILILLGAGYLIYIGDLKLQEERASMLPIIGLEQAHVVAPFSFVNQDGKVITNEDVKGKICVVSYFFATCKGICPRMNEHLALVYKAFKGNKKVLLLSHTVDPLKDTVEALKAYSARFDASADQWMFLTGDKKKLYDMARYSYLISAGDDTTGVGIDVDFIHDQQFSLVDGFGRVRGFYDGLDSAKVSRLIVDIGRLIKENP